MIDQDRGSSDEPDSFVGREQELGELRLLALDNRAVTLCGAGGIGKTRLLVRLMALLAPDFPDGAWFVELGDLYQPDLVVSRVAAAIGVAEEPGIPLIDTLADALRTRRLLLALDNCEHLVDACASLCQRLLAGSPGLQVLASSRESLRVAAEAAWPVPPLALPPVTLLPVTLPQAPPVTQSSLTLADAGELARYDAVGLFADRAASASPGFALRPGNAAAVVAICRALDGLPLAIELAAAWVRVLSVEQIADRLSDRFGLLTTRDRTVPPRQRTLRAAIDWSHDLLSEAEQVLLRRLSVFAGWSLEMAEQVCSDASLPADQILDLLAALADKSLVEMEPDTLGQARYRMLETIREYAAARLAVADETVAVRGRLREYTLRVSEYNMIVGMALVPAPWSVRVDTFRRYDADVGNARLVLGWCLADGDAETGLRICTAIRPCWLVRGTFAEGAEWLDSFLAADLSAVPPSVHGPALIGRAQLALVTDPRQAEVWATEGLELCWSAGDRFWTATALNLLAETALHTGRSEDAAKRAEEALANAREARDKWNEGYALGTRAAAAGQQGSLREAQEFASEALTVMREIDQRWGAARTLLGLGDLARLRQDPAAARQHYLAALVALREVRAGPEIARCLAGLGRIAMDTGELGQAREHLAESVRLSLAAGSRIGIARGLSAFAALAVCEERPGRAVQLAAAVTALRESAHLPPVPGARTQRYLDAAAGLGEDVVDRLWAEGLDLTSSAAVELALDDRDLRSTGPVQQARPHSDRGDSGAAAHARPRPGSPRSAWGQSGAAELASGRLTAREREVVALIALGKTNKAIAQQLFISPATAARHVANILAKLGFTSRSQIAAWAATTGRSQSGG